MSLLNEFRKLHNLVDDDRIYKMELLDDGGEVVSFCFLAGWEAYQNIWGETPAILLTEGFKMSHPKYAKYEFNLTLWEDSDEDN